MIPSSGRVLDRSALTGSPLEAAQTLLGAVLVRDDGGARRSATIVELEAYGGPEDAASHARFGPAGRSAPMFGEAGHAYVYLVYGMHHCLNVTAGATGSAAAVLIRAVLPLEGVDALRAARICAAPERQASRLRILPPERLCIGPALVAAAFGVDRSLTGIDLLDPASPVRVERSPSGQGSGGAAVREGKVASPRVGIDYAEEPWRSIPWRLRLTHPRAVPA